MENKQKMQEEHKKAVLLAVEMDEQNYQNEKEKQEEMQVCSCIVFFISNLDIQAFEQKWTKAMKAVEQKARLECDAKDNAFQETTR